MSNRSWDDWIDQYALSHQHPINRACHKIGIPLIVISLLLIPFCLFNATLWYWAGFLFVVGWIFQFVGHIFEKKPPEFFSDWRFLFVGVRWWFKH